MTNIDTQRKTNFAVTLTPCKLKENTYIARVPRRTVTTDQLLDLVSAHNQGIDRFQVGHAMELLKKEILEQAELGFAVDIMEICKLYVAPVSSVTTLTPESESVTGFEARFAVNERLRNKLLNISATVTAVSDPAPQISQITDPAVGKPEAGLRATFSARIRGHKLKLGGEKSGIFFVPVAGQDKDGKDFPDKDESSWTKVQGDYVTKNTDRMLEFHIPRNLEPDSKYFIAVRVASRGETELRRPLTGFSKIPVMIN